MALAQERLAAFWNQRYASSEFAYGRLPNDFLVQHAESIAPAGAVLCLGDGEGRNSVWLARQGFGVTAIDIAEEGIRKARTLAADCGATLHTRVGDVCTFDAGERRWDAIVSIFLHLPPKARSALHARCMRALRPGGVFLYEAYGSGQAGRDTGGPKEAALLPQIDEVRPDFDGARIEHAFAGLREVNEGALHRGLAEVVQLVVRRTAA